MDLLSLLIYSLFTSKRRYYTKTELDELKRQCADGPLLEGKPYKWWKFRVR